MSNIKETTRLVIIKLVDAGDKEKILKAEKKRHGHVIYVGITKIKVTLEFLSETI